MQAILGVIFHDTQINSGPAWQKDTRMGCPLIVFWLPASGLERSEEETTVGKKAGLGGKCGGKGEI
jgi:hypothetical protein